MESIIYWETNQAKNKQQKGIAQYFRSDNSQIVRYAGRQVKDEGVGGVTAKLSLHIVTEDSGSFFACHVTRELSRNGR